MLGDFIWRKPFCPLAEARSFITVDLALPLRAHISFMETFSCLQARILAFSSLLVYFPGFLKKALMVKLFDHGVNGVFLGLVNTFLFSRKVSLKAVFPLSRCFSANRQFVGARVNIFWQYGKQSFRKFYKFMEICHLLYF